MNNVVINVVNLMLWLRQSILRGAKGTMRLAPSRLFVVELIRRPGTVGAVCSSSPFLARTMAKQVPVDGQGLVVELGAGTGAVTAALLEQGIAPERLLVIERSPAFVRHLRHHYPSIQVVEGDAAQLEHYLPASGKVDAIVSSLPLRSLSSTDVISITDQWRKLLPQKGMLVQFTYDPRGLTPWAYQGFEEQSRQLVWKNVPPARIVTLLRNVEEAADNIKNVA